MERKAVHSRDIAIVGFDPGTSILEIAFRSGGVYHYKGVTEGIYQDFMSAPSKGTFFQEKIRGKYASKKIH
ncbi:MAG: KTSC domain-containing protein [Candidatus Omnitrophica bacterium]|nr:KTSC domain-containing protein [Candidatus Omnitrophota bacterium]